MAKYSLNKAYDDKIFAAGQLGREVEAVRQIIDSEASVDVSATRRLADGTRAEQRVSTDQLRVICHIRKDVEKALP